MKAKLNFTKPTLNSTATEFLAWLRSVPDSMGISEPPRFKKNRVSSKDPKLLTHVLILVFILNRFLWHESNWIDPWNSKFSISPDIDGFERILVNDQAISVKHLTVQAFHKDIIAFEKNREIIKDLQSLNSNRYVETKCPEVKVLVKAESVKATGTRVQNVFHSHIT